LFTTYCIVRPCSGRVESRALQLLRIKVCKLKAAECKIKIWGRKDLVKGSLRRNVNEDGGEKKS
jgi:hypothetical protein